MNKSYEVVHVFLFQKKGIVLIRTFLSFTTTEGFHSERYVAPIPKIPVFLLCLYKKKSRKNTGH